MNVAIWFLICCGLVSFLPPLTVAQSQEIATYNTTLFDALNPHPPVLFTERYSALWGYTAPDGREYALLGAHNGTSIVDITEKPIKEVAFIPGPTSDWREMKTWSHYAYVVNETGGGLQIIDLSDLPNSATLVRSDSSTFRTAHTITQEGDWIYVHGSNVAAGVNEGTLIFKVADGPLIPTLVGTYSEHYVHDATIRNDTMYAAAILDGYLSIVYLGADRTEPRLITTIAYPGAGTHNSDLTSDGRYLMTTDEVGATAKTLKVWDISDLDDIAQVAEWTPQPRAVIHNVRIKDHLAYISWYTAGTRIVDITDPVHPVQIGFFDPYPGEIPVTIGTWEIYPYFKSGKMIASSMENGLFVFTLDSESKGSVSGTVRDAVTNEPVPDATIILPKLDQTVTTDDEGRYQIVAGTGTLPVNVAALNYLLYEDGELTLTPSGAEQDILITPLVLRDLHVTVVNAETTNPLSSFTVDVLTRNAEKVEGEATVLTLPTDSSYTVWVGEWGYHSTVLTIQIGQSGEVVVPLEPGYADNAEIDLGWELDSPDDDATNGRWTRYTPVPGSMLVFGTGDTVFLAPKEDQTPGLGAKAFGTRRVRSGIENGKTTLTSPSFNLAEYKNPRLSLDLWYINDAFPGYRVDDRLYLYISNNNGESWTLLQQRDNSTDDWENIAFDLVSHIDLSDNMRFRVVAADSNSQAWVFAAVDNFAIVDQPLTSVGEPGVQESNASSSLTLFPNPVSGAGMLELHIAEHQRIANVDLIDGLGRSVMHLYNGPLQQGENHLPINLTDVAPGFYMVQLRADDGSAGYIPVTVLR